MENNVNHDSNHKDIVKTVKDHWISLKEIYQKEDLGSIQKRVQNLVKAKIEVAQSYCKENFGIESVDDAKKAFKKAKKKVKSQVKNKFKAAKDIPDSEPREEFKKEA
jgi:hypothetical protein